MKINIPSQHSLLRLQMNFMKNLMNNRRKNESDDGDED